MFVYAWTSPRFHKPQVLAVSTGVGNLWFLVRGGSRATMVHNSREPSTPETLAAWVERGPCMCIFTQSDGYLPHFKLIIPFDFNWKLFDLLETFTLPPHFRGDNRKTQKGSIPQDLTATEPRNQIRTVLLFCQKITITTQLGYFLIPFCEECPYVCSLWCWWLISLPYLDAFQGFGEQLLRSCIYARPKREWPAVSIVTKCLWDSSGVCFLLGLPSHPHSSA